jgi:hypothetical protein
LYVPLPPEAKLRQTFKARSVPLLSALFMFLRCIFMSLRVIAPRLPQAMAPEGGVNSRIFLCGAHVHYLFTDKPTKFMCSQRIKIENSLQ